MTAEQHPRTSPATGTRTPDRAVRQPEAPRRRTARLLAVWVAVPAVAAPALVAVLLATDVLRVVVGVGGLLLLLAETALGGALVGLVSGALALALLPLVDRFPGRWWPVAVATAGFAVVVVPLLAWARGASHGVVGTGSDRGDAVLAALLVAGAVLTFARAPRADRRAAGAPAAGRR